MNKTFLCLMAGSLITACGESTPDTGDNGPATLADWMVSTGTFHEPVGYVEYYAISDADDIDTVAYSFQEQTFTQIAYRYQNEDPADEVAVGTNVCGLTFSYTNSAATTISAKDRSIISMTVVAETDDCEYGAVGASADLVNQVVSRGEDGNPTLIAQWVKIDNADEEFPGWAYDNAGAGAFPLEPCPESEFVEGTNFCSVDCWFDYSNNTMTGGCTFPTP